MPARSRRRSRTSGRTPPGARRIWRRRRRTPPGRVGKAPAPGSLGAAGPRADRLALATATGDALRAAGVVAVLAAARARRPDDGEAGRFDAVLGKQLAELREAIQPRDTELDDEQDVVGIRDQGQSVDDVGER